MCSICNQLNRETWRISGLFGTIEMHKISCCSNRFILVTCQFVVANVLVVVSIYSFQMKLCFIGYFTNL